MLCMTLRYKRVLYIDRNVRPKILTGIVIRAYKKDDNKTTHNRGPDCLRSSIFRFPNPSERPRRISYSLSPQR